LQPKAHHQSESEFLVCEDVNINKDVVAGLEEPLRFADLEAYAAERADQFDEMSRDSHAELDLMLHLALLEHLVLVEALARLLH